jgi:formate dehydrogenase beta subunit
MLYKEGNEKVPCKMACPAGIDIPQYIRFVSQRKFDEALAVIREKIPFPLVCGYVCPKPCETACLLGKFGDPVRIKELKRFAAEHGQDEISTPTAAYTGKRVAIVGSGPAGLTAAYYLKKICGHGVTVFEALSEPGGMMRVGIPEYRLPRSILKKEINYLVRTGIEIKLNAQIGKNFSFEKLKDQGYDAIFIATGAHQSRKLGLEGEETQGVIHAVDFLRKVALGEALKIGDRVVVFGGGNAAIDAARTAIRLGSLEVTIAYRRTRHEMPAQKEEIEEAEHEGIKIEILTAPTRIISENGEIRGVECLRMQLAELDASGRPRPDPISGSEFLIETDTIIPAIGQSPNLSFITERNGLKISQWGTLESDPITLETSMKGIFAGGDVVSGTWSVIEAIVAGRKAAVSIDKFLGGDGNIEEIKKREEEVPMRGGVIYIDERAEISTLPMQKRLLSFNEIYLGLTEEQSIIEANRCLWCDLPIFADVTKCVGCNTCAIWCSFALNNAFNPTNAKIRIIPPDRGAEFAKSEICFMDDCDSCGICVSRCFYGALLRGRPKDSQYKTND